MKTRTGARQPASQQPHPDPEHTVATRTLHRCCCQHSLFFLRLRPNPSRLFLLRPLNPGLFFLFSRQRFRRRRRLSLCRFFLSRCLFGLSLLKGSAQSESVRSRFSLRSWRREQKEERGEGIDRFGVFCFALFCFILSCFVNSLDLKCLPELHFLYVLFPFFLQLPIFVVCCHSTGVLQLVMLKCTAYPLEYTSAADLLR